MPLRAIGSLGNMKRDPIVISGAGGLIGRALCRALESEGHPIRRLVREPSRADGTGTFVWDVAGGTVDPRAFDGACALIHLAGEPVAGGRWSAARRARIRESRVEGTRTVLRAASSSQSVRVIVSASAIGYYGAQTGDHPIDEEASVGGGFLASVCQAWEDAARQAASASDARVTIARIGVVLSPDGGALEPMWRPWSRIIAPPICGDGRQWVSWISLPDTVRAIRWCLERDLSGPVNCCAPAPSTHATLIDHIRRARGGHGRPRLPERLLRAVGGDAASETVLASQRVLPGVLLRSAFTFEHPTIDRLPWSVWAQ